MDQKPAQCWQIGGYVGQSLSVDPTLIGSAHYLQISRMAKAYHRTYSHASSIFLGRQSSELWPGPACTFLVNFLANHQVRLDVNLQFVHGLNKGCTVWAHSHAVRKLS